MHATDPYAVPATGRPGAGPGPRGRAGRRESTWLPPAGTWPCCSPSCTTPPTGPRRPPGRADWLLGRGQHRTRDAASTCWSPKATTAVEPRTRPRVDAPSSRRGAGAGARAGGRRPDGGRVSGPALHLAAAVDRRPRLGPRVQSARLCGSQIARGTRSSSRPRCACSTRRSPRRRTSPIPSRRALAAATCSQNHVGLVLMALANLSMAYPRPRTSPGEAAVHARECAALSSRPAPPRPGAAPCSRSSRHGEYLSGNRSSVRCIAQSVAHAALNP